MKTLLLLRHAKSAWSDARLADHDRPLNRRGERAAKAMADHLVATGRRPDLVLCSTALRTRQTLAAVVDRLGPPAPPILLDKGLYLAPQARLLAQLRAVADTVSSLLLVGHNDGIGDLAVALAGSGPDEALERLHEKYPTGALAVLAVPGGSWRDLVPGTARLVEFTRPRDLAVT